MSNPICFLLGAGASYPYGVPVMAGFYAEFRKLVERQYPYCFALLRTVEGNGQHSKPDLETLLYDLDAILSVDRGLSLIGGDRQNLADSLSTARELRGYLDAFIVDRCERFDRDKSVRELQALLTLRSFGALWIFTTNYDRTIENACAAHSVAWSDGFEATSHRPVADWCGRFDSEVRIVKLHGSVNWYEDDPGGALHRLDRGYPLPAYDFRLLRGSQQLRPLMIIPTLEKEALGEPYVGLADRFVDVLAQSRVLIIVGSSLRDPHIRAHIKHRLDNLRVLLVNPHAVQSRDILKRPDRTHALNAGFSELLTLGSDALARLPEMIAAATDDVQVAAAVEKLIADVSADIEDDAAISANPELAGMWKDLQTDRVSVQVAAIKAIGDHPHPAITRRLTSILTDDQSPPVRVAAVESLVRLVGREATEHLGTAVMRDPSPEVQLEAALALIHLGCEDPQREWLRRGVARTDAPPALRTIIENALGSTGA